MGICVPNGGLSSPNMQLLEDDNNFRYLLTTCGWIFSSPQEAGSRTASLKRSNQVRGLRHSRSVSCPSEETLEYPRVNSAIAIRWHGCLFVGFFVTFFRINAKIFLHPCNEWTNAIKQHKAFPWHWRSDDHGMCSFTEFFIAVSGCTETTLGLVARSWRCWIQTRFSFQSSPWMLARLWIFSHSNHH